MIYSGLVSVTFRKLSPKEIISLVAQAGLHGIEWGGDIHVPHGDAKCAREVLQMTREAGLQVASYGSYYKVGCENENANSFEKVLESALALQAPTIRVWAGDRGSKVADQDWWDRVEGDSRRIAALAAAAGVTISYEYHPNTLTDTPESACRLLKNVNHENIYSYWQPSIDLDVELRIDQLKQVMPWLSNIHVYHYVSQKRATLAEGLEDLQKYLATIAGLNGDRFAMIEFVKDNSPDQFLQDAETLKNIMLSV